MTVLEILKEKTAEEIAEIASGNRNKLSKLFNMDLFDSYCDKCSAIKCPELIHDDIDAWMDGSCCEEFYEETCLHGICRRELVKQDIVKYLNSEYE